MIPDIIVKYLLVSYWVCTAQAIFIIPIIILHLLIAAAGYNDGDSPVLSQYLSIIPSLFIGIIGTAGVCYRKSRWMVLLFHFVCLAAVVPIYINTVALPVSASNLMDSYQNGNCLSTPYSNSTGGECQCKYTLDDYESWTFTYDTAKENYCDEVESVVRYFYIVTGIQVVILVCLGFAYIVAVIGLKKAQLAQTSALSTNQNRNRTSAARTTQEIMTQTGDTQETMTQTSDTNDEDDEPPSYFNETTSLLQGRSPPSYSELPPPYTQA